MDSMSISMYRNLKQEAVRQKYNKIYAHELAHKNAAGSLARGIVIEYNSEGIPVSGHVDIKMPTVNESDPQETIGQANTVIKAALAPSDPSTQDYKVASKAKKVRDKAEDIQQQKRLDYYA